MDKENKKQNNEYDDEDIPKIDLPQDVSSIKSLTKPTHSEKSKTTKH